MKIVYRHCPNCGKNNCDAEPSIYSRGDWKIKDCLECKFVYLENCPEYEVLSSELAWEKTSLREENLRKNLEPKKQIVSDACKSFRRKRLKRDKLKQLIGRYFASGNVLDIGCASGGVLQKLSSEMVPFGIEVSENLAKQAMKEVQSKGGRIIHADAVSGIQEFEADFFSGIIMSAFLEHEMNPVLLLRESYRVIANDGLVIIKVPNYGCINRWYRGNRWCGFRYPDHVNYFTPSSLCRMCVSCGFFVRQFGFLDKHCFSDNMWIVLEK